MYPGPARIHKDLRHDGGMVHLNKDKVEYIETFKIEEKPEAKPFPYGEQAKKGA